MDGHLRCSPDDFQVQRTMWSTRTIMYHVRTALLTCAGVSVHEGSVGQSSGTGARPRRPATAAAAAAWQAALRLAQEALTLLRGLSAHELLRELVLEEHLASSASTRLCHAIVGALTLR